MMVGEELSQESRNQQTAIVVITPELMSVTLDSVKDGTDLAFLKHLLQRSQQLHH